VPELPPVSEDEKILVQEEVIKIEESWPAWLPSPLPEPDSDSSVEEIDIGIHDRLYGTLEDAFHT